MRACVLYVLSCVCDVVRAVSACMLCERPSIGRARSACVLAVRACSACIACVQCVLRVRAAQACVLWCVLCVLCERVVLA